MPRPPRLLLSKSFYHIMTRGNNRNTVFKSDEDYQYFLELIARYKAEHPFDLYHYSLMPNHTHMLVRTNKASDFSTFMKKLNLAYFYHYKKKYDWVGHFWQDRFKSQPVGNDSYFLQCGKYIEINSVRASLVEKPEDYLYSSYNHYVQGVKNSLITDDLLYEDLGKNTEKRRQAYRSLVISDMILGSYKKRAWGSADGRYNEDKKVKNHLKY